jgi:hypothetical protein
MKTTFILAITAVVLCGCSSDPWQDREDLSEAGQRMQAAMQACVTEELSRENAVEQSGCIGKAKIQAGYESNNLYMWNIEQDVIADRASAIEYAEGKIDKEAYMEALDKHWAEALKVDREERAKNSDEYHIEQS